MKTLPNNFYTMPMVAEMTMTKKDLKELLLTNSGQILACGNTYNIIFKHLGVDVYRVTLEKRDYKLKTEKTSKCPGIEIEPGVFSGCNQSGGDCPMCGK